MEKLRKAVEKATEGLVFISEGDAQVLFVGAPGSQVTEVTPEAVVALLSAQHDGRTDLYLGSTGPLAPLDGRPVEVRDAGSFFANRVQPSDPEDKTSVRYARQWRELQKVLTQELQDLRVIRFGDPEWGTMSGGISVFIVGRTAAGELAGVLTGSVET